MTRASMNANKHHNGKMRLERKVNFKRKEKSAKRREYVYIPARPLLSDYL